MIYDILDIQGKKLPENGSGFKDISGPIYIFVGGLFHLEGSANGAAFKNMLDNLSSEGSKKAQALYIQEKTPGSWEDKLWDGYLFEKEGKISQAAIELAHGIFLPADTMKALSPASGTPVRENALTDLKNHFSRITLMGYSYGTSIIRQMEVYIAGELAKAGLSDNDIKSVVQCGVALDVGPAYSVPDTSKTLTHFVTVCRDDMMTRQMADFVYPDHSEGAVVTTKETGNSLILVPETGSATVRSVSQDAANPSARRVHYDHFEDAHSLLMYINIRETLKTGDKVVSTYPSVPTARLLREFNAMAITASTKATPRNGPALLKDFQRVNMAPGRLQKLAKEFRRDERYFEQKVAGGQKPEFHKSLYLPAFLQSLEKGLKNRRPNP